MSEGGTYLLVNDGDQVWKLGVCGLEQSLTSMSVTRCPFAEPYLVLPCFVVEIIVIFTADTWT